MPTIEQVTARIALRLYLASGDSFLPEVRTYEPTETVAIVPVPRHLQLAAYARALQAQFKSEGI
jgi:hypothetical protein